MEIILATLSFLHNNSDWQPIDPTVRSPSQPVTYGLTVDEIRWVFRDMKIRRVKLEQLETEMDSQLFREDDDKKNAFLDLTAYYVMSTMILQPT